jgi:D-cysteine desulfhydrase
MLGKQAYGKTSQVDGIRIDKEETGEMSFDRQVRSLANKAAALAGLKHEFGAEDIILNEHYLGAGYGVMGVQEEEAIAITARTEGILLDPVYTGRAMGGLIDMVRTGELDQEDRVLFWHTGGTPALFAD